MTAKRQPIPFFTDNDVADAVGDFLLESGHEVTRLREVMLTDSPDPVVAEACRQKGLVLVTHNVKHFKRIAKDYRITKREIDSLCRIDLECHQAEALTRIQAELELIEFEWKRSQPTPAGLRIAISNVAVRIHR